MGTDTFLPNGGLFATGTQRSGFPLEVVEEIVLLMLVLEEAYGLQPKS